MAPSISVLYLLLLGMAQESAFQSTMRITVLGVLQAQSPWPCTSYSPPLTQEALPDIQLWAAPFGSTGSRSVDRPQEEASWPVTPDTASPIPNYGGWIGLEHQWSSPSSFKCQLASRAPVATASSRGRRCPMGFCALGFWSYTGVPKSPCPSGCCLGTDFCIHTQAFPGALDAHIHLSHLEKPLPNQSTLFATHLTVAPFRLREIFNPVSMTPAKPMKTWRKRNRWQTNRVEPAKLRIFWKQ